VSTYGRVLAIDQGSSATNAAIVSVNCDVLASTEAPVTTNAPFGGGVELDSESIVESVIAAGRVAHGGLHRARAGEVTYETGASPSTRR
jgi:glycerol kinase